MVLDELQRRNYALIMIKQYLRITADFAGYFGQPIEKLGPNHIRAYQAHLFRDRKLASRTSCDRTSKWKR
jgi:integrase/recombinase XerD